MKKCLILAIFVSFLLSSCQIGNLRIGGPRSVGFYSQSHRNRNNSKPKPTEQDTSAIIERKQKAAGSIKAVNDSSRIQVKITARPDSTKIDSTEIKKVD